MNKILLLAAAILLSAHLTHAQRVRVLDSLTTVANAATSDTLKYDALHELVWEYFDDDNLRAFELVKLAEVVAYESGDVYRMMKSQRLKAQSLYKLGRTEQVLTLSQKLVDNDTLINFEDEYLMVLNLLAVCYSLTSQFDQGLKYQFETLEWAKRTRDREYLAMSTGNIGFIYYKLKDYRKALPFMLESYEMKDSLRLLTPSSGTNLSLCYAHLEDFEKAGEYLNKSVESCEGDCDTIVLVQVKYAAGCIDLFQGRIDQAAAEFQQALDLSEGIKDDRMFLENIYMLSKIHLERREFNLARNYLELGKKVLATGPPYHMERIKLYEQLAEFHLLTEDYKNASFYQAKYIALRDSTYNESVTSRLMQVEADYAARKSSARIAKQQQLLALSRELLERRNRLDILSGLVVSLAVAIILILLRNYRRKKALNVLLDQRVEVRTRELEGSRLEFATRMSQNSLVMRRSLQDIAQNIGRIKGLCNAAKGELQSVHARKYLDLINLTADDTERDVKAAIQYDQPEISEPRH